MKRLFSASLVLSLFSGANAFASTGKTMWQCVTWDTKHLVTVYSAFGKGPMHGPLFSATVYNEAEKPIAKYTVDQISRNVNSEQWVTSDQKFLLDLDLSGPAGENWKLGILTDENLGIKSEQIHCFY